LAWLIDLYCGRLDTAVRVARTNVEFARTLSHPYSLVLALSAAALTHVGRGEGQAAVTRLKKHLAFVLNTDLRILLVL
jgi:hypothetical protein